MWTTTVVAGDTARGPVDDPWTMEVDKSDLLWTVVSCPQVGSRDPAVIHKGRRVIHGLSPQLSPALGPVVMLSYPQSYPQPGDNNGDKGVGNGQITPDTHLWITLWKPRLPGQRCGGVGQRDWLRIRLVSSVTWL